MAERDNISTLAAPQTAYDRPGNSSTERSADEIRQNIAATRESITETVDELSSMVQRTFDWKSYVADHPLAAVGVAAGLGLTLGYLIRPRVTPGERISSALAELGEDFVDRLQGQLNAFGSYHRPGLSETLRTAAISKLVQTAGDFARTRYASSEMLNEQNRERDYNAEDVDYRDSRRY